MGGRIRVTQVLEATAGGTRRYLSEIVAALPSDLFDLHIVCALERDLSFEDDLERYRAGGHRVSLLRMRAEPRLLGDQWQAYRLRQLLSKHPTDILHLHAAKAGWIGRLAARGLPCRVLYTPHGFRLLQEPTSRLRRAAYALAEKVAASGTDLFVAVAEAEAGLALQRELCERDRVCVLPNAIDADDLEVRFKALEARAPRDGVRSFGLIGELRPQKGPLVLLEAIRLARDRGVEARFVLPARGVLLDSVRAFVRRYHLESVVELVSARDSLIELYGRVDVAILPSLWEGLPYSALEALALRRPVIASSLPVFEDLLADLSPGLLFASGDSAALAARIDHWSRCPEAELRSVGAAGHDLVCQRHPLAAWRAAVCDLYRRVFSDASS